MNDLSREDVARLRAALEAASAGPWAVNPVCAQVDAFQDGQPLPVCQMLWPTDARTEEETEANAWLIASARALLPALLARLDEVEVAVAQAVEFAEYVEGAARGAMVERAKHFLSLPYSQEVKERLALAEAVAGAPEVKVYAGHDGYAEIMLEPHVEAKAQLVGQRVRLLRVEAERGGEG